MDLQSASAKSVWPFPFEAQDWEHTPTAVQSYVHTLHNELTRLREQVEVLEARLQANSTTSICPQHRTRPTRSHVSERPQPHVEKWVESWVMRLSPGTLGAHDSPGAAA